MKGSHCVLFVLGISFSSSIFSVSTVLLSHDLFLNLYLFIATYVKMFLNMIYFSISTYLLLRMWKCSWTWSIPQSLSIYSWTWLSFRNILGYERMLIGTETEDGANFEIIIVFLGAIYFSFLSNFNNKIEKVWPSCPILKKL